MEQIRYSFKQEKYGKEIWAFSAKGLCALFIGDKPEELVEELQKRFPEADLVKGKSDFSCEVLDERGTPFQKRVWQELREIPRGLVLTYSDLAKKLGMPKAVRAVGTACGANPLAVVTPCHRVIGKDGKLRGYRWGLEIKLKLLELEGAKI